MDLRILLLGAVELQAGESHDRLGTPKERTTLAALAWDAGRTVSLDTLVHRVWDEHPPAKPREALYVHIHRIRKALAALAALAGSRAPTVISRTHTYTLDIDPDAVDLRRYLALVEQGRGLSDSGSHGDASTALQSAARLWSGEPLAGLPGAWAAHVRRLVGEQHLASTLLQADIALRSGRFAEAVAGLRPLSEQHRTDESFTGQLALALHGCGRTNEANRLLQRLRHHLRRESGSDPGEETAHIHRGILAGRPVAELLPPATAVVSRGTVSESPDTLPPEVAWVGRESELDVLMGALSGETTAGGRRGGGEGGGSRVTAAVITGMPGSGKTALASHTARLMREDFPDGTLFVDLRGQAPHQPRKSPSEALREILSIVEDRADIPGDFNGLVAMWRTTARKRRLVVVLDDAASIEQVSPLLPGDSSSAVIITSRHRLAGLPGVRHIALDVLPPGDSVTFLRNALGKERAPDAVDAATVARLCGHLPLALDITVSRLLSRPSWQLSDLVERFARAGRRLPEIRAPHRELVQSLEVSYQALTPEQQRVFRSLGLHIASEFGSHATAALTGLSLDEAEKVLEELLACHLISEPSPHRYRLHDLLREYASTLARSDAAEAREQSLENVLAYYLHAADQADRHAYPHRQRIDLPGRAPELTWYGDDPQQWFTTEGPALLAALEYTRAHRSPRDLALLTHTLAGFLGGEGYLSTAAPLLETAAEHWRDSGDESAYGRALVDQSIVCASAGNYDRAMLCARQALESAQNTEDEELTAEALHQLSISCWHTARLAEAFDHQHRALQIRLTGTSALHQGRSFNALGMISLALERNRDALTYFVEGLARFRGVGDRRGQFIALNNIAELHKESGDLDSAEDFFRQSISLARELGSRGHSATLHMNLADTLRQRGELNEALELYEKALPALRSAGDRRSEAIALTGMGQALHAAGRSEQAISRHTAALSIARDIRAALEECRALAALGEAEAATGRLSQAETHLEAGLALSRKIGSRPDEVRAKAALGRTRQGTARPGSDA
ncbi:AfsR/SARP family transcriptional regulator [Streptomyces marispadix]|uniref:Tetratricopeptide repeat protein n=1 Tax=Streptomyces marispadix TaxID=2922868 RepID=A0ABS9T051_9ACTN|nr:tetratricopeptide repeat protein [Streptomyces marispadix]MCH6161676.1 tetratricopeptide repeat protein [Streptomyces marispadix]